MPCPINADVQHVEASEASAPSGLGPSNDIVRSLAAKARKLCGGFL